MSLNNPLGLTLEISSNCEPGGIEHKIFDILLLYLPENGKLRTREAAEHINGLYPANRPGDEKERPEEFLSNLWSMTNRLAGQIDYDSVPMNRLVSLIKTLRDLPSDKTLEPLEGGNRRRRVWQDLPDMLSDLGELYRQINFYRLQPDMVGYRRWRNTNGFIASLAANGVGSCYYYALVTARMALEEVRTKPKDKKEMKTIVQCYVPVAAAYFILCAPALYEACLTHWGADSATSGGPLWSGEKGYSTNRWEFWMSRFKELAEHEFATVETRAKALQAVDKMRTTRDQQTSQGQA